MKDSSMDFPDLLKAPQDIDLLAISAVDLHGNPLVVRDGSAWPKLTHYGCSWSPEVLMNAYSRGLFPMPLELDNDSTGVGWWSPAQRAIFYLDDLRISRSLRRSVKKFTVTCDVAFTEVVRQCGNPQRPQGWIDYDVVAAYTELHRLGHAHSVEVWLENELVGGLYGVSLGGIFAGESMFHVVTDASKVALIGLVSILRDGVTRVIDTQWITPHLASLGASTVSRSEYLMVLDRLRTEPNAIFPVGLEVELAM